MKVTVPQVISIHHDGREVLRNEEGVWRDLPTTALQQTTIPTCVKFFFDGKLVYHLEDGIIHNNDLKSLIQDS